jgi:hypothetical protein
VNILDICPQIDDIPPWIFAGVVDCVLYQLYIQYTWVIVLRICAVSLFLFPPFVKSNFEKRKDGKNDAGCSILKDENLIIYVEMQ